MPKVSILTPLYNTNPIHLRQMIESILNQTYTDFEFLILNDSPQNKKLEEIVNSYNDSRIKYYKNESNLGISESRNKLLQLAKGEYIAIFDHDDISLPTRLEREVNYLNENPLVGVVSCNIRTKIRNKKSHFPIKNSDIKIDLICRGCVISHTSSMIRKEILVQNNIKWEQEFSPCEDYMLWGKLIDKTMFHNINESLVIYRDHNENTTHLQRELMDDKSDIIKNYLYNKYPYFAEMKNSRFSVKLFNFIPFIQSKRNGNKIKYFLFGIFPILKIEK